MSVKKLLSQLVLELPPQTEHESGGKYWHIFFDCSECNFSGDWPLVALHCVSVDHPIPGIRQNIQARFDWGALVETNHEPHRAVAKAASKRGTSRSDDVNLEEIG